jgi:hypothetical protein
MALIVVMGARVPVELRIFLTAAAIVDDIGAIVVVAVFYSGEIHPAYVAAAAAVVVALALLSRSRVYLLSYPVGRRVVGVRLRGRPPRYAGRRGACAVHSDTAARRLGRPDDAGQHHHRL